MGLWDAVKSGAKKLYEGGVELVSDVVDFITPDKNEKKDSKNTSATKSSGTKSSVSTGNNVGKTKDGRSRNYSGSSATKSSGTKNNVTAGNVKVNTSPQAAGALVPSRTKPGEFESWSPKAGSVKVNTKPATFGPVTPGKSSTDVNKIVAQSSVPSQSGVFGPLMPGKTVVYNDEKRSTPAKNIYGLSFNPYLLKPQGLANDFRKKNSSVARFSLQTKDGKKFGRVSEGAYKAILEGKLDTYVPIDLEEHITLSKYVRSPIVALETNDGKSFGNVSYIAYNAILRGEVDSVLPSSKEERQALSEFEKYYRGDLPKEIERLDGEIAKLEKVLSTAKEYKNKADYLVSQSAIIGKAQGEAADKAYEDYLKSAGYESIEDIIRELTEKSAEKKRKENAQKNVDFTSVVDPLSSEYDKDFGKKSKYNPENEPLVSRIGDNIYGYINADGIDKAEYVHENEYAIYDKMTDREVSLYNYYYNEYGKQRAAEYLKTIEEDLHRRSAEDILKKLKGNRLGEMLSIPYFGLNQVVTSVKNAFNTSDEYIPYNTGQILSSMVSEDIPDKTGWQVAFDLGTSVFNMLPSIAVGALIHPVAGAALMGVSTAGGEYQEKLNSGMDKKQARIYSSIIGFSEAGLQYVLGGIGKLGGKISAGKLASITKGIHNAGLNFALRYGGKIASEGFEESLQSVLAPLFENMVLGYAKNENVNWEEVAYSGMLGALTAGLTEGPSVYNQTFKANKEAKSVGASIRANGNISSLIEIVSQLPSGGDADNLRILYEGRGIDEDNMSDLQIGRLYRFAKEDVKAVLDNKKNSREKRLEALSKISELSSIAKENDVKADGGEDVVFSVKDEKTLKNSVRNDKIKGTDGSQYRTMWTIAEDVLTEQDVALVYRDIENINNRDSNRYTMSAEGDYILEINNKLVYTDADSDYPTVSSVVTFGSEYEDDILLAKELVLDEERSQSSVGNSFEIIEAVYGKGFVKRTYIEDSSTYKAMRNRGGEGSSSAEADSRSGKNVATESSDNDETLFSLGESSQNSGNNAMGERSIVFDKDLMLYNNKLQLDNVVMQAQIRARSNKKRLPKMQYSYTSDYFVVWSNKGIGKYDFKFAIEAGENKELISAVRRELENGTYRNAESFNARVNRIRSGKGRGSRDNSRTETPRANRGNGGLSSGQSASNSRRNSGENVQNSIGKIGDGYPIRSDSSKSVPADAKSKENFKTLYERLGYSVISKPNPEVTLPKDKKVDGYVDHKRGEVYIAPDSENGVYKHELMHIISRMSKRNSQSFLNFCKENITEWDKLYKENEKKYNEIRAKDPDFVVNKELLEQETIADLSIELAKDEVIEKYRDSSLDFLGRVRLWFRILWNQAAVYFGKDSSQARKVAIAKMKWELALASAKKRENSSVNDEGLIYKLNKKWVPDLSKRKLEILKRKIAYDARTSTNNITDTANWMFTNIDGTKVFAIYSTQNIDEPTLLYESKGEKAEKERDILLDLLEEIGYGENSDGKSAYVSWVFGSGWVRKGRSDIDSDGTLGRGRSDRDAGVLQGQSRRKPSPAFRSVIKNLFEIQGADRRSSGSGSDRDSGVSFLISDSGYDGDASAEETVSDEYVSPKRRAKSAEEILDEIDIVDELLKDPDIDAEERAELRVKKKKLERSYADKRRSLSGELKSLDERTAKKNESKEESVPPFKYEEAVKTYKETGDSSGIPDKKSAKMTQKYYAERADEALLALGDVEGDLAAGRYESEAERLEMETRRDALKTQLREAVSKNEVMKQVLDILDEIDTAARPNHTWLRDVAINLSDKQNIIKDGLYKTNDVERNFRNFFGKYFKTAYEKVLKPFYDSKKNYAEGVEEYAKRLREEIVDGLKIKAGSKESAAVMWLGEGKKPINKRAGAELASYTYEDCVKEFGEKKAADIKKASEIFRKMYDELLDKVNETRAKIYPNNPDKLVEKRKDYFHHFQEMGQGFAGLRNILNTNIGIDPMLVGTSEHTKPKSKWQSFAQRRLGERTEYDAVMGFLKYLPAAQYSIHIDPNIVNFRSLAYDLASAKASENKGTGNPNANVFIEYLQKFANSLAGKTVSNADRGWISYAGRTSLAVISWLNNMTKASAVLGNVNSVLSQVTNVKNMIGKISHQSDALRGALETLSGINPVSKIALRYNESGFLKERFLQDSLDDYSVSKWNFKKVMQTPGHWAAWVLGFADEIGTRITWNAAYNEAIRKDIKDAAQYADNFTRQCVAGRGIGEDALVFKSQMAKLFLPFRTEVLNDIRVQQDILFGKEYDIWEKNGDRFDEIVAMEESGSKDISPKKLARAKNIMQLFIASAVINAVIASIKSDDFDPIDEAEEGFEENGVFGALEAVLKDYADGIGDPVAFDPIYDIATGVYQGIGESESVGGKIGKAALRGVQNVAGDMVSNNPFSTVMMSAVGIDSEASDFLFNGNVYTPGGAGMPLAGNVTRALAEVVDEDYLSAAVAIAKGFVPMGTQIDRSVKGFYDYKKGYATTEAAYERMTGDDGDLKYLIEPGFLSAVRSVLFGSGAFSKESDAFYNDKSRKFTGDEQAEILSHPDYETRKVTFDEIVAMNKYESTEEKDKRKEERAKEFFGAHPEGVLYDLYMSGEDAAVPYKNMAGETSFTDSKTGKKYTLKLKADEAEKLTKEVSDKIAQRFSRANESEAFAALPKEEQIKYLEAVANAEYKQAKVESLYDSGQMDYESFFRLENNYRSTEASRDRFLFVADSTSYVEYNAADVVGEYASYSDVPISETGYEQLRQWRDYASSKKPDDVDVELMRLSNATGSDINVSGNPYGVISYQKKGVDYKIDMPDDKIYALCDEVDSSVRSSLSALFKKKEYKYATAPEQKEMVADLKRKVRAKIKEKFKARYKSVLVTDFDKILTMK